MRGYATSSDESYSGERIVPPQKKKARPFHGATLSVCSFNVGMQQNQLESPKGWNFVKDRLSAIVDRYFNLYKVNVVCLSEFGSFRKGASTIGHIDVDSFMMAASDRISGTTTEGAYCSVFDHSCTRVSEGVYVAGGKFQADMAWQILLVDTDVDVVGGNPAATSGAAQPAGKQEVAQVFVVIGNAHIVCGKKSSPNLRQKRASSMSSLSSWARQKCRSMKRISPLCVCLWATPTSRMTWPVNAPPKQLLLQMHSQCSTVGYR